VLDTAILKPASNLYGLAEARVKTVGYPTFDRMFVGSMSPFREGSEPHGGCRSPDR
jgi:hypothetical protein